MSSIEIGGKEFQTAIFEVMRRASADPEFRALALKDGTAAVKKVSPGLALSAGAVIQFHQKSATNPPSITLNFVLPQQVASEELSEAELEQVAGGAVSVTSVKITTA